MLRNTTYSSAYNHAMGTTVPYRGTDHTVKAMIDLARGDRGERSIKVRRHAEQIITGIRPKDYASEAIAVCRWWGNAGRYTRDPVHIEMLRDPERLIDDAEAGKLALDCFPEGTLLLRDDFTFVPVEHIRVGDRIWGRDKWSEVQATASKGALACDAVRLNNGNWLRLTPDHKVYVADCPRHKLENRERACSCPMEQRVVRRITVAELEPQMVLVQPDRIAFGRGTMDPDRALIEGLYLSDGWCQEHGGFFISGQDGCPKEEQKREVAAACARLEIQTTWHRKSIYIADSEWRRRLETMGTHAPQKRALSIDLSEGAAAPLLRGIMADSGKNTCANAKSKTLTTTSRMLMLQTRILLRMFGIGAAYSYIENHGGLGLNPIYRLSTRERTDGKQTKLLRVKEIVREATVERCYDITTDDHYVYLPECDVTVSNCDEFATAIGTSCLVLGLPIQFVTVGFQPRMPGQPKVHTHVFVRAQDPRTKIWWVLDPVAGRRTGQMLSRVRQFSIFEV